MTCHMCCSTAAQARCGHEPPGGAPPEAPQVGQSISGLGRGKREKFSLSQSETEAFGPPLSIKVHADLLVTLQPQ